MYIEPLALFIIAEVVVVFIIISVILFRRSRLLRVLLSILTEKRLNRLRLESEEHKELLALRKDYGKLQAELLQMRREGGKTYAEQVQNRLDDLKDGGGTEEPANQEASEEEDQASGEDPHDPEGTHRTRAIRRAFYEFEATRAAPLEHDIIEAEERLLEQLKIQLGRDPDEEESELARSQHAELLTRIRELETVEQEHKALQKAFKEQEERLGAQNRQIEELKRIEDTSRLDPGNHPTSSGGLQDEIYRLKCERFDMAESINNLKLRLQKLVDDGDANGLIEAQREQIEAQERYIQDADENIRLLEEELSSLKDSAGEGPVNTEPLDRLTGYADEQKASMADIRDNLKALRAAEKSEEKERLLEEQEAQLTRMERSVQEAETCVTIMEGELADANRRISELEAAVESTEQSDRHRQQADELEQILQRFVTDSEDMIACISGLEDHNKALRQLLQDKGVPENEIPRAEPPRELQSG